MATKSKPRLLFSGWIQVSNYMIRKYGYELAVLLAAGNKIIDPRERVIWKKNWIQAYITRLAHFPMPDLPPGSTTKENGLMAMVGETGVEQIMRADGALFNLAELKAMYVSEGGRGRRPAPLPYDLSVLSAAIPTNKPKQIHSCVCLTCGLRNDHSHPDGFCQNGHDDWFEYRDIQLKTFTFKRAMDLFGMTAADLTAAFINPIIHTFKFVNHANNNQESNNKETDSHQGAG